MLFLPVVRLLFQLDPKQVSMSTILIYYNIIYYIYKKEED